jgi:hypothetical protein
MTFHDISTCKGCRGTAPAPPDGGFPVGWYGLTVSVPAWLHKDISGKRFVWIGLYCCAACLVTAGPAIAAAEELARQAYDAVVPQPRNPVSRRGTRP